MCFNPAAGALPTVSPCASDPLRRLAAADPEAAETVVGLLARKSAPLPIETLAGLVEDILWGLAQETAFGRAVAAGLARLSGEVPADRITAYRTHVRAAGRQGPTLGRMVATYLVPVLQHGHPALLDRFLHAVAVVNGKGTYALKGPLEALPEVLAAGGGRAAADYLGLLSDAFAPTLSYSQCRQLADLLPKAIRTLGGARRRCQLQLLGRIVRRDPLLVAPFLDGYGGGLDLLPEKDLARFVSRALDEDRRKPGRGARFLGLESRSAADLCRQLQVAVSLPQVRHRLQRYLQARIGRFIPVHGLTHLPGPPEEEDGGALRVVSDGRCIYLPDRIGQHAGRAENIAHYQFLARLEAACFEFGTFDFDLERALDRCRRSGAAIPTGNRPVSLRPDGAGLGISDLERFWDLFRRRELAADLFMAFEHGRQRLCLIRAYPGLVERVGPFLENESRRILTSGQPVGPVFWLYVRLVLGKTGSRRLGSPADLAGELAPFARLLETRTRREPLPEAAAELVALAYPWAVRRIRSATQAPGREVTYRPMPIPFNRRLRPDLVQAARRPLERRARQIQAELADRGINVYLAEIRQYITAHGEDLSAEELAKIVRQSRPPRRHPKDPPSAMGGNPEPPAGTDPAASPRIAPPDDATRNPVFWYPEWDAGLGDYLRGHVRVVECVGPSVKDGFYEQTLERHRGLRERIRNAFQHLKPQGHLRLRPWPEGDHFDYAALLGAAIDRAAGRAPSERLYVKTLKSRRDVAVLVLLDLSRSTANPVPGGGASVLAVAKEALVLACDAVEILGDAVAVAGFSGSGRLGVDYVRVKEFHDTMSDSVRWRINALAPRRNTRMGAAIRHACRRMEDQPCRTRLLVVLGDGYPNDLAYKRAYAAADTGRAIAEARARNIFVHAITIGAQADSRLDDLFGRAGYNVITDVRELPAKLFRVYGGLTG